MSVTWGKVKFIVFDFDGVFTDNRVYVFEDGREAVRCSRGDGLGLENLRKKTSVGLCVLSKEKNPVVAARCRKLKIECLHGCDDKLPALKKLLKAKKVDLKDAAFVGNDLNDMECLKAVGLPIVVADGYPQVKRLAKYVTKTKGGNGAIREICDLIIKAQG